MKNKKFKYWPYILIAGMVLLFSAFSPFLFSKFSFGPEFGEDTGSIGDTIGGITAPFLSLVGSILVFAALKAQIEANETVQEQFNKQENELKLEAINKIELLQIDLEAINKDIALRAKIIKEYYENERQNPFDLNVLKRTPSKVYSRILELERESLYKGFKQFKSNRNEWIIEYNKLYLIIDFLPDFFEGIYNMSDRHMKDVFDQKMVLRNKLIDLTGLAVKFNEDYKLRFPILNIQATELYQSIDKLVSGYHSVIDESYDEKGNLVRETNLKKISEDVLFNFINEIMKIRRNKIQYDPSVMPLLEIASEIRREIELLNQRAIEISTNIEIEYSKLIIDGNEESILTQIKNLHDFISNELSKVNISKTSL